MTKINKYQLKNGETRYMFNTYLGFDDLTGKKKYTTKRGFKTIREAKLALSRIKVDVDENGLQAQKKASFKEIYELWLVSVYKNTVRESTFSKTEEMFNLHILPAFESYNVDEIKVTYCQSVVNDWCERLAKYRMMKNYTTRVLSYACTLGYLKENPMDRIVMPKRKEIVDEEKEENFYTKEQLMVFLECCKADLTTRWYTLFHLLAFSGFRKSEALALEWKDINFNENTISVSKSLARAGNTIVKQPPKNKASYRIISIDHATMGVLKEWKKRQAVDMLKLGYNTMNDSQLVFSKLDNGMIDPNHTTAKINRVIENNNLPKITTHGLRHTHCSLLFESGAPIEVVKERLGHSSIETTMNIYTHVTPKSKENTAQKFAEYLGL